MNWFNLAKEICHTPFQKPETEECGTCSEMKPADDGHTDCEECRRRVESIREDGFDVCSCCGDEMLPERDGDDVCPGCRRGQEMDDKRDLEIERELEGKR